VRRSGRRGFREIVRLAGQPLPRSGRYFVRRQDAEETPADGWPLLRALFDVRLRPRFEALGVGFRSSRRNRGDTSLRGACGVVPTTTGQLYMISASARPKPSRRGGPASCRSTSAFSSLILACAGREEETGGAIPDQSSSSEQENTSAAPDAAIIFSTKRPMNPARTAPGRSTSATGAGVVYLGHNLTRCVTGECRLALLAVRGGRWGV